MKSAKSGTGSECQIWHSSAGQGTISCLLTRRASLSGAGRHVTSGTTALGGRGTTTPWRMTSAARASTTTVGQGHASTRSTSPGTGFPCRVLGPRLLPRVAAQKLDTPSAVPGAARACRAGPVTPPEHRALVAPRAVAGAADAPRVTSQREQVGDDRAADEDRDCQVTGTMTGDDGTDCESDPPDHGFKRAT
jgi:hypothetical protein